MSVLVSTVYIALVVVRKGHRFLLVQEAKRDQRWYLPAGRVDPGERLEAGAIRETLEEAGVPVAIEGIVRVEHTPAANATARVRVIYTARPIDDTPPKQRADEHSIQAAWVTLEELEQLPLRSEEVRTIFTHVAAGAPIYPASLIVPEGAPYPSS